MARVLEQVTKTARKHDMFDKGDLVLVSVSGGPDSVCLLHALHRLRRLFKIGLAVFHFDHKLRQDSAKDADYVRRMATRLGLEFHLREAQDSPLKGASIEAWAHVARIEGLIHVVRSTGATKIARAHTLDDQAETVLIGLLQGWGAEALGGIHPVNGSSVEPLLGTPRAEVEAFCRALGLRPRKDPSNRDLRFLRNAVRLRLLPAVERAVGRGVASPISSTAEMVREDMAELFRMASEIADRLVEVEGDPSEVAIPNQLPLPPALGKRLERLAAKLAAEDLVSLPPSLGRRVARRAFQMAGFSWTKDSIEAVLDLAKGRPGRRRNLPGGLLAVRGRDYVRISRPSPEGPDS